LGVAVSPAGKKTFILYRKVAGRPERITIGPYPDLSIEQARGKAEELNSKISKGENPAAKRRAFRDEDTLAELFASYCADVERKRSLGEHKRRFRLYLAKWRFRKISSITHGDVVALHTRIRKKRAVIPASAPGAPVRKPRMLGGPYAANRVIELLSVLFNYARAHDWKGENPAEEIKAFRETKRERYLEPDELPAFFKAVEQETNKDLRDCITLCLLTGARRANVQAMRWDEISWPSATWRIPAEKAKEDEPIMVVLSGLAMRILQERKIEAEKSPDPLEPKSEFVFPGRGKTGHLVELKSAWKRILERANLEDLRLHDLRRTLGSWQVMTGASLAVIGKSLGHADGSPATKIYARMNLDPVRVSVTRATDAMLAAGAPAGLLTEGKE